MNNKKKWLEYLLVSLVFIAISVIFASKIGLLNSGYHFTDDHEIVDITSFIASNGVINAIGHYIVDDLAWRFRPIYFLIRVLKASVFGSNFFYWHLWNALEVGVYMSLSYILARQLKASTIPSVLFSFAFLIGSQDEIIWRLGPQENMGLIFLALTLIFARLYVVEDRKKYGVFTGIFIICMITCKESFLLMSPAIFMYMFYFYLIKTKENEDINIFAQLGYFIKRYWLLITLTIMTLLISGIIIFGYTGLYDNGYSGIDTSYSFGDYCHLTLNVFIRDLKDYWLIFGLMAILAICAVVTKIIKKNWTKQYFREVFVLACFTGYSLVGQAIMHGSSSMFTRYYIPTVWIIYFVFFILEEKLNNKIVHSVLCVILFVFAIYTYDKKECSLYMDALCYAEDGQNVTEMLNYAASLKNDSEDTVVLTDYGWYELNYSASVYLQNIGNISEVYHLDSDRENGDYKKIYRQDGKRIGVEDANIVLTDYDEYDSNIYEATEFNGYYVLKKK